MVITKNNCKLGLLALAISLGLSGCNLEGDNGSKGTQRDQGVVGIDGTNGTNGTDGVKGLNLPSEFYE